jgi:hypothetical protein
MPVNTTSTTCDHLLHLPDRWVETYNDWTGEMDGEWEYHRTRDLREDLDLHRIKCSRCGHIDYYSGAARRFYEDGVRTPGVTGLE